ncbi:hypothetical protein [Ramlibacter albus]|uniref:Uncharacterized protein n=1 Tax=Ramlibacter albus TaxID=2079448 RepID=A0A923S616_9BURK|nr:hypothetical protein [Ramlibacter albus]MBC5765712.1 hypothetical protein [Ramlibacter albus]
MRPILNFLVPAALVFYGGCGEPFSWPRLMASKITYEYPSYRVDELADGKLLVHRPGMTDVTVDVEPIGRFCQRGPKDCSYATDQVLMQLRGP